MRRNIDLNRFGDRVSLIGGAVGAANGQAKFSRNGYHLEARPDGDIDTPLTTIDQICFEHGFRRIL
jgi:hypothetical protein